MTFSRFISVKGDELELSGSALYTAHVLPFPSGLHRTIISSNAKLINTADIELLNNFIVRKFRFLIALYPQPGLLPLVKSGHH